MSQSIENLAALWTSIEQVCASFDEEQWKTPTGCPGWSVQDNVAHLIDYESRALGRPTAAHEVNATAHVKNDLGAANELAVDFRRSLPGAEVLAEFREVTSDRLAQLRAMSPEEFEREMDTPAGRGTVASMVALRVMDTWWHEQDIRRAVGRPGNVEGPAADQAIDAMMRFVPLVVVKRAQAPDGSRVVFRVGSRPVQTVVVEEGRGSWVDGAPDDEATAELRLPATTFAAVVGGRDDVPDDIEVSGDAELAERILAAMAFMP